MSKVQELEARQAHLVEAMDTITASAEAAKQNLTEEQQKQFDDARDEYRANEAELARLAELDAIKAQRASIPAPKVAPAAPRDGYTDSTPAPVTQGRPSVTGGNRVAYNYSDHGFKQGIGEFLLKVREAKVTGRVDQRLMVNTISTYAGEGVGADGAYLLPPQFQQGIMQAVQPEDSFLNGLNQIQTNSNMLVVPADEDPPWGSTGITAAKTAEAGAITASKPVVKKVTVVMHKLAALVHVSEESLSDIPFLATYVQNKMGQHLRYKMENYVMNGTGEDEPLGILNAPGLISLSENSTAATLSAFDVYNMKAAALPGRAFWVVSPTILPAVWSMKTDATAGYPLFNPDVRVSPDGQLAGLPMYRSETCKAINTAGDIVLVVADGYIFATNGGVSASSTVAFAFDQDLQSFKATLRMGGAPVLSGKVTRANGSTYASHLIALAGSRG